MFKTAASKLQVHRQTLRNLTQAETRRVRGGRDGVTDDEGGSYPESSDCQNICEHSVQAKLTQYINNVLFPC